MTYETYIFEPVENKRVENERFALYIALTVVFLATLYVLNVPFIGLGTIGFIAIGLISIKRMDDKKKGAKRFGHFPGKLILTPESLDLRGNLFAIKEFEDLEFDVKDFVGKKKWLFWQSEGVNNEINFTLSGRRQTIQFLVKKEDDLELVKAIIEEMGNKTSVATK